MTKRLLAVAAAMVLSAAAASAGGKPAGEHVVPAACNDGSCTSGGCADGGCGDGKCGKFGLHPWLKGLFGSKDSGKACKGKHCAPPPPGAIGGPPVGTLVFPNYPFTRSPRDFFMYGQGGL